jgi:hypothetical protein
VPGIVGLITKMAREWAEPRLLRMVEDRCGMIESAITSRRRPSILPMDRCARYLTTGGVFIVRMFKAERMAEPSTDPQRW